MFLSWYICSIVHMSTWLDCHLSLGSMPFHLWTIIYASPAFSRAEVGGLSPYFQVSKVDVGACQLSLSYRMAYDAVLHLVLHSSISGNLWALDVCFAEGCKTKIFWLTRDDLSCGCLKGFISNLCFSSFMYIWFDLLVSVLVSFC